MIVAVWKDADATLSGQPEEYVALADVLARGQGRVELDAEADVRPFDYALSAIEVTSGAASEAVVISLAREHRVLHIDGPLDLLAVLADNVRTAAGMSGSQGHIHVEYFPGHFYLGEGSLPLTVKNPGT